MAERWTNPELTQQEQRELDEKRKELRNGPYSSELADRELEQAHKEKRPTETNEDTEPETHDARLALTPVTPETGDDVMSDKLQGRRIAVLATDGFEQAELEQPVKGLRAEGAKVEIVAPKMGEIQGYNHQDKGDKFPVDRALDQAKPADYDALVLPGGVINPDSLRLEPKAIAFIREFVQSGKPISAVCHGPWTLIDAGGVKGRKMTSWPSLKADLTNAGANWVDEQVVVDGSLVTSRKPDDLPAFVAKTIEVLQGAKKLAAE